MAVDTVSFGGGCWLIAALLCGDVPCRAADLALVYSGSSAAAGASVAASVVLSAGENAPAALQFDLLFDDEAMSVSPVVDSAIRGAAKSLFIRDISSGHKRIVVAGLNQQQLQSGALLQLFLHLTREATGKLAISLQEVAASDSEGLPVEITSQNITIPVSAPGVNPVLQPEAVRNAASLLSGAIAPGELITLLGSGIGASGSGAVSVLFDGQPGVLLYAAANQVNVAAPASIAGSSVTHLQILTGGTSQAESRLPVSNTAPGLFVSDSSGTGALAALNEDGSANSTTNPARAGSALTLFATGLGLADSAQGNTLQLHVPLSVSVGGEQVQVLSIAPGPAAGIMSVRIQIPDDMTSGWEIPVSLNAGGSVSQTGATLSIQ